MKNFSDGVRGYLFQVDSVHVFLDGHQLLAAARYLVLCPQNFAEMLERLTGRELVMRKAGRPLKRAS